MLIQTMTKRSIKGRNNIYDIYLTHSRHRGTPLPICRVFGVIVKNVRKKTMYPIFLEWLTDRGWGEWLERRITEQLLTEAFTCLN